MSHTMTIGGGGGVVPSPFVPFPAALSALLPKGPPPGPPPPSVMPTLRGPMPKTMTQREDSPIMPVDDYGGGGASESEQLHSFQARLAAL